MTLPRPELWLNRLQQLCRTCNPRPTKLWPTAGLQRQLFTWKGRLSRHSAGLTIPPWMTAVWVSLFPILPTSSSLYLSLALFHIPSTAPVAKLRTRHFVYVAFYCTRHSTTSCQDLFLSLVSLACLLSNLDIVYMFIIELEAGCSKNSHNMMEAMLTSKKQHEIVQKGFFPL